LNDQQTAADVLREVAVHAEALLEQQEQHSCNLLGKPLVQLYQDPDLVPFCPECGELHQHFSDDLNGRWSCNCSDETYFLEEWLFWVASHTGCRYCNVPPSGDLDGLYCVAPRNYCVDRDTPVQPAEWISRNQQNSTAEDESPASKTKQRINKLLADRYGDEGLDQTVARLQQKVDQLELRQQQDYTHLSAIQAADFSVLADKLDTLPGLFTDTGTLDEATPSVKCTAAKLTCPKCSKLADELFPHYTPEVGSSDWVFSGKGTCLCYDCGFSWPYSVKGTP
jgi:hypothetical protein